LWALGRVFTEQLVDEVDQLGVVLNKGWQGWNRLEDVFDDGVVDGFAREGEVSGEHLKGE